MVHIFLILFSLLNCIGQIYGGENTQVIRVPLYSTNMSKDLIYAGEEYHNACKKFGMRSNPEDPFCSFVHKGREDLSDEILKNVKVDDREQFKALYNGIEVVPFDSIVTKCEKYGINVTNTAYTTILKEGTTVQGLGFKKEGEIISSSIVKINENEYDIVLIMPQVNPSCDKAPETLLGDFKREPSCFHRDKEELVKNGIIILKEEGSRILHGPNGYGTYYVRLFKKVFGVLFVGAIMIYFFYLRSINPC